MEVQGEGRVEALVAALEVVSVEVLVAALGEVWVVEMAMDSWRE